MSTLNVNKIADASGGVLAPISSVMRNRIINGAMVIDQRNAGASISTASSTSTYTLDRWISVFTQNSKFTIQQNAGSVTPPVGFANYIGITTTSAYTGSGDIFNIGQNIEGFNTSDLGFGTANAKTITISFWVRSSLTGTFGGALQNSALNRSYPFTFTISVADTWEYKTIIVAGDTSGTWIGATNGIGLRLWINLGSGSTYSGTAGAWAGADYRSATGSVSVIGTLNATFYITGVQLEVGTQATGFEYRPFGTELILAQRYFETTYPIGTAVGTASTTANAPVAFSMGDSSAVTQQIIWIYKVKKCSLPTVTIYNPNSGASGSARYASALDISFSVAGARVDQATLGSGTVGMNINNTFAYYLTASSEL